MWIICFDASFNSHQHVLLNGITKYLRCCWFVKETLIWLNNGDFVSLFSSICFSSSHVLVFTSSSLLSSPLSDLSSLRTLLLHNNQLSLLSGDLLSSLPSLEKVSLHSNPLRCDCLSSWGPHIGNQSHLKLLEPSITLCSFPQHLVGRELQEVVAVAWGGGGADSCLPHISPHAFPSTMNVSFGQPITLECWADADPAPQFYWVTPTGDKVGGVALVGVSAQVNTE